MQRAAGRRAHGRAGMELDLPTLWLHFAQRRARCAFVRCVLYIPFIFHHFFTAKSAIDLAILVLSGHSSQEITENKTALPSFIFGLFLVIHFLAKAPRPLVRCLSSWFVSKVFRGKKRERNKGAPICKLP